MQRTAAGNSRKGAALAAGSRRITTGARGLVICSITWQIAFSQEGEQLDVGSLYTLLRES